MRFGGKSAGGERRDKHVTRGFHLTRVNSGHRSMWVALGNFAAGLGVAISLFAARLLASAICLLLQGVLGVGIDPIPARARLPLSSTIHRRLQSILW